MKTGKVEKINWNRFKVNNFKLPIYDSATWECGAFALYSLLKKPKKELMKLSKNGHWPTKTVVDYLKKHNCEVIQLHIGNLVDAHSAYDERKPYLNRQHVLLIDQMCYKEENTWSVIYNGFIAHSGDVDAIDINEFINYPIEDAYLIYNRKWK